MELLLDTAAEVFLECGYKNANVAEIANRAGASKRTIYARYPSKAELFCAVVSRKIGELQEAHARTLLPNEPLAKVLDDYGMSLLQSMLRPQLRALFQVVVSEIGEFPELACAFWELGPKRLTAMLEEYLATHPEFKGEHPDHAAEMFCCLCWGIAILKKQFFKEYVMPKATMRQNVTEAVRIFMAAYATAPTAQ
jgi:AcrR family transcriptional regulator